MDDQSNENSQTDVESLAHEELHECLGDQSFSLPTLEPNMLFGRYLLLKRIGKGGMGQVFAAYDSSLDRKVALKFLLKDSFASSKRSQRRRERLLREAQATAQLSDPHIVAVYDVGVNQDVVFMAMELIKGQTLKEWSRSTEHTFQEVLGVYLQAARGLAAAHKANVIHRDFKPANAILGQDGRVRVLDFGLAAAIDRQEAESITHDASQSTEASVDEELSSPSWKTPMTQEGALIGTTGYMSPEQHLRRPVDERSDQFSFCVSLYWALYGHKPFIANNRKELLTKISRAEMRPPGRDSNVPGWVRKVLIRGLTMDPDQRWDSMEELIAQLAHDPQKRRMRILKVLLFGLLAVLIAIGVGYTYIVQNRQCQVARDYVQGVWDESKKEKIRKAFLQTKRPYAQSTFERIDSLVQSWLERWVSQKIQACRATRISGEQSDRMLDLRMLCLGQQFEHLRVLSDRFSQPTNPEIIDKAIEVATELPDLTRCADVHALLVRVPPPDDNHQRKKIEALNRALAEIESLIEFGRISEGLALSQAAVKSVLDVDYPSIMALAYYLHGRLQQGAGEYKHAKQTFRKAALAAARGRDDTMLAKIRIQQLLNSGYNLLDKSACNLLIEAAQAAVIRSGDNERIRSELHHASGLVALSTLVDLHRAQSEFRKALDIRHRLFGENHPKVAASIRSIGLVQKELGHYELAQRHYSRALAIFESVFGPDHPTVAKTHNSLGNVFRKEKRYALAERHFARALAIVSNSLGPEHPEMGKYYNNLGMTYDLQGKYQLAQEAYQKSHRIFQKTYGDKHFLTATSLNNLGVVFLMQGEYDKAYEPIFHAFQVTKESMGPDHPDIVFSLHNLGDIAKGRGQYDRALGYYQRALHIWTKTVGAEHQENGELTTAIGEVYLAQKKLRLAHDTFEKALHVLEKRDPGHIFVTRCLTGFAQTLLAQQNVTKGLGLLERALGILVVQKGHEAQQQLAVTRFVMAQALVKSGDQARALKLANLAKKSFVSIGTPKTKKLASQVEAFLRRFGTR